MKLWKDQAGICWICKRPMLPPEIEKVGQKMNKWSCNVDHIGPKEFGKMRPVKGAHLNCNSARGHKTLGEGDMQNYIRSVHWRFADPKFIKDYFGNYAVGKPWENGIMFCYQDKTFCVSPDCKCSRKLTAQIIKSAGEWWKGIGGKSTEAPIAKAYLCSEPTGEDNDEKISEAEKAEA